MYYMFSTKKDLENITYLQLVLACQCPVTYLHTKKDNLLSRAGAEQTPYRYEVVLDLCQRHAVVEAQV